jgi:hypothetical protein
MPVIIYSRNLEPILGMRNAIYSACLGIQSLSIFTGSHVLTSQRVKSGFGTKTLAGLSDERRISSRIKPYAACLSRLPLLDEKLGTHADNGSHLGSWHAARLLNSSL